MTVERSRKTADNTKITSKKEQTDLGKSGWYASPYALAYMFEAKKFTVAVMIISRCSRRLYSKTLSYALSIKLTVRMIFLEIIASSKILPHRCDREIAA